MKHEVFTDASGQDRDAGRRWHRRAYCPPSSELQQLGRQTGKIIIALSQLSRPDKDGSAPTMSSLRHSGQIEQDADVVLLLYRECQQDPTSRRKLVIAKNKDGRANEGTLLDFDGDNQRFKQSNAQPLPERKKAVPTQTSLFRPLPDKGPTPFDEKNMKEYIIMKIICIMNLKGGVGKTVTADNMAAILAADHGKRVLLIDADHQGNTSRFFHADQEATTLREILTGEAEPYWPENVQRTGYEGLDIIPAGMSLAELDTSLEAQDIKSLWRLRDMLLVIEDDNAYDYVIIDMPPAFSLAARAALVAADEVIVPIKLDAFSVDGMAELLRQINSMKKVNPGLTLAGVLITMWRNVDVVNQAEKVLRSSDVPVFDTTIRRTDIVDESTFQREPLVVYSPRSAACVDYRRLVAEYLGRASHARKAPEEPRKNMGRASHARKAPEEPRKHLERGTQNGESEV